MEILAILFIFIFAVIFLKFFAVLFHTGMFLILLPFKILAFVLSTLLVIFVLLPLGIVGAITSLLLAPLALAFVFMPLILIIWGIFLLLKE